MKKKFLFPVMAMVFAIGLSFATERTTATQQFNYVDVGAEQPLEIPANLCDGNSSTQCLIMFENEPNIYEVYEDKALQTPRIGGTGIPIVLPPRN